ncbi:hypothetical protein [Microbispora sp. NPDC046933]|uniref:hypothetical protein n=1 Tax=Microbispora sp. NPDC046933 TaxID=3155618 RepID=UPI0033C1CD5E
MRPLILSGFAASLLLACAAPASAAETGKPLTPAQLRAALLTPEDLGDGYVPNTKRNREVLDAEEAHTKKCATALRALKPLLKSRAAVFINEEDNPAGVKQFALSGTSAAVSSWKKAGTVMVRDCAGVRTKTHGVKQSITRLSVGKLGNWAYGIRYSKLIPSVNPDPIHASDLVLIGAGNTVTLLVTDGFFGTFDPDLSERAAQLAVPKLRDAQETAVR